jgi:hypothetical protein
MHAANFGPFAADRNTSSLRSGLEAESVMGVNGLSMAELTELINLTAQGSNRTLFRQLSTPDYPRHFAIGTIDNDLVPWTQEAHNTREQSPYVPLRTSRERLSVTTDANNQRRVQMSSGTDFMVDFYYDTPDFLLYENGIIVRGRNRQDQPGVGRRVLIQTKIAMARDESGLKRVAKEDTRFPMTGTVPANLDQLLDLSIKSGLDVINRKTVEAAAGAPLAPMVNIYRELRDRRLLPMLDGLSDVLLLSPQAVVFSVRSRFHFQLMSAGTLAQLANGANALIDELAATVANSAASQEVKQATQALAANLKSPDFLAERTLAAAQRELPDVPADTLRRSIKALTEINAQPLSRDDVYIAHQLALERRKLYRDFSDLVSITGEDKAISRRKLENAATAGLSLWFLRAASTFGETLPTSSDFMIDTFDHVTAIPFSAYSSLSREEQIMQNPIPLEKIFFNSLSSDAQVELTSNVTFENCFRKAQEAPADLALQKDKAMCEFLLAELSKSQTLVTQLRGQEVVAEARRRGFTKELTWANAENSKGENVLRIARDLPPPMPVLPVTPEQGK